MKRIIITALIIMIVPVAGLWGLRFLFTRHSLKMRADYLDRMDRAYDRFQKPEWGPLAPEIEEQLLEAHRPLLVVSRGSAGPIDIDVDYLAVHHPADCDTGASLAPDARRELLTQLPHTGNVCLNDGPAKSVFPPAGPLCGGAESSCAKVFTAVEYENVRLGDSEKDPPLPWIFLRYEFVFASSGLPQGLIDGQKLFNYLGAAEEWHPLDLGTIAWVVLDENQKPVAAILSQHSGHRTYVFGTDTPWPRAGRMPVVSATRSNQLYPDLPADYRRRLRASHFVARREYLVTGEGWSWFDGDDIVCGRDCGGTRWDYRMERLRPTDPLWMFRGYLGPRRLDFGLDLGRSGPPGGRYHSFPELVRRSDLLFFSYYQDGDPSDAEAARNFMGWWWKDPPGINFTSMIQHGRQRLRQSLESARKNPPQFAQAPAADSGADEDEHKTDSEAAAPALKPLIEPVIDPRVRNQFMLRNRQRAPRSRDAEGISLEPGTAPADVPPPEAAPGAPN